MSTSTHTWKTVYIEGSQFKDEESFHREFSFKFGFPDNYGMNFDALYDCLSGLDLPGVSSRFKLGKNEEIVIQVKNALSFFDSGSSIYEQFFRTIIETNKKYKKSGSYTRILIELI
ncbi:hypothetical protein ES705_47202 [subsurface metagenome]